MTQAGHPAPKAVWLDCDPGHDDAIAMLVALFAPHQQPWAGMIPPSCPPALHLLGCSVVGGNAPVSATMANAARLLEFFAAPLPRGPEDLDGGVHLLAGSELPLLKPPRCDPDIHGEDGLGGVTGLPELNDAAVQRRLWASYGDNMEAVQRSSGPTVSPRRLLLFWNALLTHRIERGMPKMTLIATGPLTNVALLIKAFPDLVDQGIDEIVIMGGTPPGEKGNRGPLSEFNILVDPDAAAIVFDYNIPVIMAGLNVTHQAIFTPALMDKLLTRPPGADDITDGGQLRTTVASMLNFFASTYETEFGFMDGPPVHDFLAVAYVLDPTLFYSRSSRNGDPVAAPKRYKVQVETNEGLAVGATVVDYYAKTFQRPEEEWWGRGGRNAIVLEHLDVDRLWELFFRCVERAEIHRPPSQARTPARQ